MNSLLPDLYPRRLAQFSAQPFLSLSLLALLALSLFEIPATKQHGTENLALVSGFCQGSTCQR